MGMYHTCLSYMYVGYIHMGYINIEYIHNTFRLENKQISIPIYVAFTLPPHCSLCFDLQNA